VEKQKLKYFTTVVQELDEKKTGENIRQVIVLYLLLWSLV